VPAALATGLCTLTTETTAERLVTDHTGRVTGVALVAVLEDGRIWRRTIDCAEVVVAAGATETPRLLLNSAHDSEPHGLATSRSGRAVPAGPCLRGRDWLFEEDVVDLIGPGASVATCDFRHGNDGSWVGGCWPVSSSRPRPRLTTT